MSNPAKLALLGAFLFTLVTIALQVMTSVWLNLNTVLACIAAALAVAAIVIEWRLYWDFFTMRNTKYGMNMGLTIVLTITALVCVNYIANRHNKTWDVTQEKLNSLSDQTTKILDNLKDDIKIKIFFKGAEGMADRTKVKQNLQPYQEASRHVQVDLINSYVDTPQALKYLNDQPDKQASPIFVFVEYKEKRLRVDQPFDEATFTSAIIKATRTGESKVYFIKGHGEKDLEGDNDQGLKEFTKALNDASFQTIALNLIDKKEIPKDTGVLAIVGPEVPYLEDELKWIRKYVQDGGKVFIALDPGQRQNLANLTKTLGIEFENNYVITQQPLEGWGPAGILGVTFDATSDITRSFPTGASFALFPLASEVKSAPGKSVDIETKALVKSGGSAFTITDLTKPLTTTPKGSPITIGMSATGKLPEGKPFSAVVFGDSDFISNRGMMIGVNRDLALNALALMTSQSDLISIRPKLPKGSMVVLSGYQRLGIVIGGLSIPLFMLIAATIIWFRRRGA